VNSSGHRGGTLLLGITTGVLLIGGVALQEAAIVPPLPAAAPLATPAPVAVASTSSSPALASAISAPVTKREVLQAASPVYAVVMATNYRRTSAGCPALKLDHRLTAAAQRHASDMAVSGYYSHTSEDGKTFAARIREEGYRRPGGENIAQGQWDEAEVVGDWMASPGHRRNIVDCSFTAIGVGFDGDGDYWVQNFGR
jgi:uncharacterized protein YkwD